MKYRFVYVILILFAVFQLKAGDAYKIKIHIDGNSDSILLLTTYYGEKIMLVDTAFSDKPGFFLFEGDSLLPQGIYMAVSNKKKKLFEFIVNDNQQFSLNTDTSDYTMNMHVKGSPENKLFFDYAKFNEKQFRSSHIIRDTINRLEPGTVKYEVYKHKMDSVNKLAADYKIKVINANPDLFITKLFNAMRDIEIPDSVQQSSDSTAIFRYYKEHYWDYFDLSDARLLHTPLMAKKVNGYFQQMVIVHPDSVINEIDKVIARARPSKEVVSWLVWHFVSEYQNPKYMGFDPAASTGNPIGGGFDSGFYPAQYLRKDSYARTWYRVSGFGSQTGCDVRIPTYPGNRK